MDTPRRRIFTALLMGLALLSATQLGQAEQVSQWEWKGIDRIVAIGDVHGSYDDLVRLLRGTGLVDDSLTWTGGTAHLVMTGDLVDRGHDDRKVMELVMRLQGEAPAAGGQVHALLGNHDVMVLNRDLRYVDGKSYAAFAPDEDPAERDKAWKRYATEYSATGVSNPNLKAAFDDTYPPGYFAYLKMLDLDGPYGAWALTRPVIIKINGIVFVHGGLTEDVAAKGLEEINRGLHENIADLVKAAKILDPLVKGLPTYEEIARVAHAIDEGAFVGGRSRQQDQAGKKYIEASHSRLMATDGPVWYRGNSLEPEPLERRRIDDVLKVLQADALVVGHTPTADGQVTSRFHARVHRLDVGLGYGREPFCGEFKGNEVRVFNPQTMAYQAAFPENPQGQQWSNIHAQLDDRQLEEYLKKAKVTAMTQMRVQNRSVGIVQLEDGGMKLRALFGSSDEKPPNGKKESEVRLRKYKHEVAAYWLDRRLKLRMVPVTIIRTVEGKPGALQIMIESGVDRVWIEEQNLLDKVREELREQIDKAWVMGALLDVAEMAKEGQTVLMDERRIMIRGSTMAFSYSPEIQTDIVPRLHRPINPSLANELRTLNRGELKKNLNDYLSDGQIDALLKRRDKILELCASNNQ